MVYEDRKVAAQMSDQNGLKSVSSNVFVSKTHRELEDQAAQWNKNKNHNVKIVPTKEVGIVGGWRTLQKFLSQNESWVGVIGEFEFNDATGSKAFKLAAEKISKAINKTAKGLEKVRVSNTYTHDAANIPSIYIDRWI